jgi:hypothetical protein
LGDKDASTVDATRELARLGSLIAVSHADKTAWNGRGLASHVEDRVLPIQIKVVDVRIRGAYREWQLATGQLVCLCGDSFVRVGSNVLYGVLSKTTDQDSPGVYFHGPSWINSDGLIRGLISGRDPRFPAVAGRSIALTGDTTECTELYCE